MTKTIQTLFIALLFLPLQLLAQTDTTRILDDIPEGLEENTDALLLNWNMQNMLVVDTTIQTTGEIPVFEDADYIDRLKRIPCVMDLCYNDIVRKYIDQYTGRLRRSVSIFLGAANFYIPIMEEALACQQVPLELKYLPIIESALNPSARSKAGAVGLWQFMPATATRYTLQINSLVDERCEPIKSSQAAARYLKDLYNIFGDWTLVIAAYNCGPNNVSKAIHRAGGEKDFWRIYPYLPTETRGYVPAFIAANYIMNYYGEHNIQPVKARIPIVTDTILVAKDVKMDKIAEMCGIDINEIKALNPQYLTNLIPGYRTTCTLRLPQEHLLKFIDLQDSVYVQQAVEDSMVDVRNATKAKEVIDIYASTLKKSSSKFKSRSSGGSKVTVRSGQTLGEIAKRNHTTVDKLKRLNNISGTNIRAGQKLRVR